MGGRGEGLSLGWATPFLRAQSSALLNAAATGFTLPHRLC